MSFSFSQFSQALKIFAQHVWRHKEIVLIVLLATWLRVYQLDTQMILFGDAASDIQNAITAVETRQLPLLGIASSVPRFKQGPLTVWLEMLIYICAGKDLYVFGLVFAGVGIAAVIGCYELFASEGKERIGLLSSFLLALSPLAIAHSRVPYHIVPIPLCLLIYLWTLRHYRQKPGLKRLLWAVLGFCLLFQFELALAPLFLLIPYLIWRHKQQLTPKVVSVGVAGLLIGLLPQVIFDFTHRFAQIGGFLVWVLYRVVALAAVKHAHGLSLAHVTGAVQAFSFYFTRIWSVDLLVVTAVMCLLSLAGAIWIGMQFKNGQGKKLQLLEIILVGAILLGVGYFIHGSPSEAYFPPWEIFLPILAAVFLESVLRQRQFFNRVLISLLLGAYGLSSLLGISSVNFFVSTSAAFSYGPSLSEQRQVTYLLRQLCQPSCQLLTTRDDGKFTSYFAGYRLLLPNINLNDDQATAKMYLEAPNSPLNNALNVVAYHFPSVTLFQPITQGMKP